MIFYMTCIYLMLSILWIIIVMIKIKTHIIFVIFLFVFYVLFNTIYERGYSESFKVLIYYSLLSMVVYVIHFINHKRIKWLIVLIFMILTALLQILSVNAEFSLLYIFVFLAPANIPFLPDQFVVNFENFAAKQIVNYLIFVILPIVYWYALYLLSKVGVKQFKMIFKGFFVF